MSPIDWFVLGMRHCNATVVNDSTQRIPGEAIILTVMKAFLAIAERSLKNSGLQPVLNL